MTLSNSFRSTSVLGKVLDEIDSDIGQQFSESSLYPRRKSSVYPSVIIEGNAPERYVRPGVRQLNDDVDVIEIHDYDKSDAKDLYSRDPSFTRDFFSKFDSLRRYGETQKKYEKQFQREIEQLLEYQPTAYELAYLHRHMSYTTLWPPLHTRRELKRSPCLFYPYTKKEKRRLQLLLGSRM